MKWISIKNKQPQGEVLAIGYQGEMLIGYVQKYKNSEEFYCETSAEALGDVTHWIDLNELRKLHRG